MQNMTQSAKLRSVARFDDVLPHSMDPVKEAMRQRMVDILNTKGEILPAADKPLGKLWTLVNSPTSTMEDCESIILLDPSLVARIFRVANSAAYRARAGTISEALRFVGLKIVREFIFSAGVFEQFASLGVPEGWDIFWLRSIFVARMTARMTSLYLPSDGSEYLAGLIADVGWLFLAAYAPEESVQIWNSKGTIAEAEEAILPFGHANVSAAVAAKSCLPLRAIDAVLYHHRPALTTTSTLVAPNSNPLFLAIILGVADKVADACQLDIFTRSTITLTDVLRSPEVTWLKNHGKPLNLEAMVDEEVEKAQDIYTAFFSGK